MAPLVALVLGVPQYVAGGLPLLAIRGPLVVLGAVAVLDRRQRLVYLLVVFVTALSPLLYLPLDHRVFVAQAALAVAPVMEMALPAEYGDRLANQRRRLAEVERTAFRLAVRDQLTSLGNRRALTERITPGSGRPVGHHRVLRPRRLQAVQRPLRLRRRGRAAAPARRGSAGSERP